MSNLYNKIEELCKKKKVNITTMCKEASVSRGSLTDLKAGRSKNLSSDAIVKISKYFGVPIDYLQGKEGIDYIVLEDGSIALNNVSQNSTPHNEDLKFALFNGSEGITDEMFEEVKQFAEMVRLREEAKKNKKEK